MKLTASRSLQAGLKVLTTIVSLDARLQTLALVPCRFVTLLAYDRCRCPTLAANDTFMMTEGLESLFNFREIINRKVCAMIRSRST